MDFADILEIQFQKLQIFNFKSLCFLEKKNKLYISEIRLKICFPFLVNFLLLQKTSEIQQKFIYLFFYLQRPW